MKWYQLSKVNVNVRGFCLSLFLLLCFCINPNLNAQKQGQELLDSLLMELPKAKADTNKVNLLKNIADKLRGVNPKQGLEYCSQGIGLAEKLQWKKGVAICMNSKGMLYYFMSDFPKALEALLNGLKKNEELLDKHGIANNLGNIGIIYFSQNNYPKALEYYLKALKLSEELGDLTGVSNNVGNIGIIYYYQGNYEKALEYNLKSLKISEDLGDKETIARNLGNVADIYSITNDNAKALEYYSKGLKLHIELGYNEGVALALGNIGDTYKKIALNSKDAPIKERAHWLQLAIANMDSANKMFLKLDDLNNYNIFNKLLSEAYELNQQFDKALIAYKEHSKYKDSIFNLDKSKELTRKELDYTYSKREDSLRLESEKKELQLKKEIQLQQLRNEYAKKQAAAKSLQESQQLRYEEELKRRKIESEYKQQQLAFEAKHQQEAALAKASQEKKDALNAAALGNQKAMTNASLVGAILLLLVALVSIIAYRQKRKANSVITQEKQRSDALLLNILPEEIAEELKNKGTAEAKHFDQVTVLFTDFVNFTQHSERLSPTELVASLNECFTAFDAIIERNGLEKIKTIGDAYMAVCGLPVSDSNHAFKTVQAALEIRDYISERNHTNGANGFEIRIGLHSGSVVAGIIGVKKFAYDIWGDTVNFAARMEQHGEAGKINISSTTFELVKGEFNCQYRGKIQAKNKGEIDMYFVN